MTHSEHENAKVSDVRRIGGGRGLRWGPERRVSGNGGRQRNKGLDVSWQNGSLQRKSGLDYGLQ